MHKMLSLISAVILTAACGGKIPTPEPAPAPTISFASASLEISPEGGEASLRVNSSARWTVGTDGQTWYTLVSGPEIFAGESLVRVKKLINKYIRIYKPFSMI